MAEKQRVKERYSRARLVLRGYRLHWPTKKTIFSINVETFNLFRTAMGFKIRWRQQISQRPYSFHVNICQSLEKYNIELHLHSNNY